MKSFSIVALAVSIVSAAPLTVRTPKIDDLFVLQFALVLEHLENAFYQSALSQFNDQAFTNAGLPEFAIGRAKQIGEHEAAHVQFLEAAISGAGGAPVKPCEYSFPFTDPVSFFELSEALELTGDAAYLGAAPFIESKVVLGAAASILSTEGRHSSWVRSSVQKHEPWSGAFEASLNPQQVFTIANQFIKSCPSDNFNLDLTPFPALKFDTPNPVPGQNAKVTFNSNHADGKSGDLFVAFITGIKPIIVPIKDDTVAVPQGLQGSVFAIVTNNATDVSDASTIAGPTILLYPFDSKASNAPVA